MVYFILSPKTNLDTKDLRLLKKYLYLHSTNYDIRRKISDFFGHIYDLFTEISILDILQALVEDLFLEDLVCSWQDLVKFAMTTILEFEYVPNHNPYEKFVSFRHAGVSFYFFLGIMNAGSNDSYQTILVSDLKVEPSAHDLFLDYDEISPIGNGSFSTVYRIRKKETNDTFAVKVFSVEMGDYTAEEDMLHECSMMEKISGIEGVIQPITQFKMIIFNRTLVAYTMQYYPAGTISGNISVNWTKEKIFSILFELAKTTRECNKRGVFHGDIKPPNIVVGDESLPILADFGIAVVNPNLKGWYISMRHVRYTQWYRDPWNFFQKGLKDFRVSILSEIWALLLTAMSLFSKGEYNYMNIFSVFRNGSYFQKDSQTRIDSAIDYLFEINQKESIFFKKWLNIKRFMDINRQIPKNHPNFFDDLYNEFLHDIEALLPKTKPSPVLETDSD
jgi:serine/threonine protein kinase